MSICHLHDTYGIMMRRSVRAANKRTNTASLGKKHKALSSPTMEAAHTCVDVFICADISGTAKRDELNINVRTLHDLVTPVNKHKQTRAYLTKWLDERLLLAGTSDWRTNVRQSEDALARKTTEAVAVGSDLKGELERLIALREGRRKHRLSCSKAPAEGVAMEGCPLCSYVATVCAQYLDKFNAQAELACISPPFPFRNCCHRDRSLHEELLDVVTAIVTEMGKDGVPGDPGRVVAKRIYVAALRVKDDLAPIVRANSVWRRFSVMTAQIIIVASLVATIFGAIYGAQKA